MSEPLTENQIQEALASLPGWAFAMTQSAEPTGSAVSPRLLALSLKWPLLCERSNHHPELTNVYSTVTIRLNTHDAGGKVTEKDIDLAGKIENLNEKRV